jgi:hypothetical protein
MVEEIQLAEKRQAVFSDTLCAPVRPPACFLQRALIDANNKTTRKTSAKTAKQRTSAVFVFLLRSPN